MRSTRVWVLWALATALVLVGSVSTTIVDFTDPADIPYGVGFFLLGIGAASAGALVTARVPGNAVGPLLLGLGGGVGLLLSCGSYAELSKSTGLGPLPGAAWAAWLGDWPSVPVFFGLTAFLLLLFPNGRLPSPRWRGPAWLVAGTVASASASQALSPGRISPGFPNPAALSGRAADVVVAVENTTDRLALPLMLLAALGLVVRLRRASGVQRQQLKAFTYVAAVAGLALGVTVVAPGAASAAAFLVALLALATLPVVAGIAIVRHRLYDIDVVIKRTLVYGPLTAALLLVYFGAVLASQVLLLPVSGDSDLAVAASTLTVAAAFRPLRTRIQSLVDRRFYRARYDAVRTVERFSSRLRDELDLQALGADLRQVVTATVAPEHVRLWLRGVPR